MAWETIMEKSNIPAPVLDSIRGLHAAYLLTRGRALSIMPIMETATCDGGGDWATAQLRIVEDYDTVEVSINFKNRSDAL
jgi:hypothetical protein